VAESLRRLVIGVGNLDRGDDGVGRFVARKLRDRAPEDLTVVEENGEATALIERFGEADALWIIDAGSTGARPGTIHRFDVAASPLPKTAAAVSTHGFGLGEAIELARRLGRLPPRAIVYTVELERCAIGTALTPAVAASIDGVIARLRAEMEI
jgi:hydrogenase maturation protease